MSRLTDAVRSRGRFGRGVIALSGGAAFGQALALATAPVLSRLYEVDEFGTLALFLSGTTVLLALSSLQYELAIPLPDTGDEARRVCALALALNVFAALLALVVLTPAGTAALDALGWETLDGFRWLVPLTILLTGTYQVLTFWALRQERYPALARTRIWQAVAQAATSIGAGAAGFGAGGLLAGGVAGRSAGAAGLARSLDLRGLRARGGLTRTDLGRVAGRYRRFAVYATPANLTDQLRQELPTLALASLYGVPTAGLFLLTRRLLGAPMTLVGKAVGEAYLAEVARRMREDRDSVLALIRRTQARLFQFGLVPFAVTVAAGPWLFTTLLGPEWREAGEFARVLAPAFLAQLVNSPLSNTLHVMEQQRTMLVFEVTRLACTAAALFGGEALGLSALGTVTLLSVVLTVTYAVLQVVILRRVSHLATTSR